MNKLTKQEEQTQVIVKFCEEKKKEFQKSIGDYDDFIEKLQNKCGHRLKKTWSDEWGGHWECLICEYEE